jgi:hypothetical protein
MVNEQKPVSPVTVEARLMRARAEAQTRARKRLRERHRREWDRLYAEALEEVFAERGLGAP